MADELVISWPDRHLAEIGPSLGPRDAVCVLTHDPKFDVPAIVAALQTKVGYLGAMGSRRTTEARAQRLREAGVSEEGIARVMGPIGLDIGARTPEETAVSICAEIIASRTGREAPSLRDRSGPIHRDVPGFPQRDEGQPQRDEGQNDHPQRDVAQADAPLTDVPQADVTGPPGQDPAVVAGATAGRDTR